MNPTQLPSSKVTHSHLIRRQERRGWVHHLRTGVFYVEVKRIAMEVDVVEVEAVRQQSGVESCISMQPHGVMHTTEHSSKVQGGYDVWMSM